MKTLTDILIIGALMFGAQWLAQWGAPRSLINVKPFNCAPCLTFWVTITALLVACACGLVLTAAGAIILSYINFTYVKTKITIYE